jgi:hypothetical protein
MVLRIRALVSFSPVLLTFLVGIAPLLLGWAIMLSASPSRLDKRWAATLLLYDEAETGTLGLHALEKVAGSSTANALKSAAGEWTRAGHSAEFSETNGRDSHL